MIRCPKRTWKQSEFIGSSIIGAGCLSMRVQFTSHRWANSIEILRTVLFIREPLMEFSDCNLINKVQHFSMSMVIVNLSIKPQDRNHLFKNSTGRRPVAVSVQINFLWSDFTGKDWEKSTIAFGLKSILFDVTMVPRAPFLIGFNF